MSTLYTLIIFHRCQIKFEETNAELNKKLSKEETVKTCVSDVQSFNNELAQKSQQVNRFCVGSTSPPTNSDNVSFCLSIWYRTINWNNNSDNNNGHFFLFFFYTYITYKILFLHI